MRPASLTSFGFALAGAGGGLAHAQLVRSASRLGTNTKDIYGWLQKFTRGANVYINLPWNNIFGGDDTRVVSVASCQVVRAPVCVDGAPTSAPDYENMDANRELFVLVGNVRFMGGLNATILDKERVIVPEGCFCKLPNKNRPKPIVCEDWDDVGTAAASSKACIWYELISLQPRRDTTKLKAATKELLKARQAAVDLTGAAEAGSDDLFEDSDEEKAAAKDGKVTKDGKAERKRKDSDHEAEDDESDGDAYSPTPPVNVDSDAE